MTLQFLPFKENQFNQICHFVGNWLFSNFAEISDKAKITKKAAIFVAISGSEF